MKKNKKKPLVTVLMNCYNVEKFIYQAIKSVLKQSHKNLELIILDDASKDKTVKIIKSFKDKRIKLFQNKINIGLGPSRVKAQKKIRGDYIAIADADDYNSSKRIEKQLKTLQSKKNISFVCSWIKYVDNNNQIIGQKKFNLDINEIRETLLWKNILPHSSIMYKKNLAKKVGWYSKKLEYSQDYDLSLKLLKHYKCDVIKEFLAFHRIRKDSMTATKKLQKKRIQEHIINLKNARVLYKGMNNHLFRLNTRSIELNELKLLLLNFNFLNIFSILKKIFKILIQFPEVIFLGLKKIIIRRNLNIIIQ